MFVSNAIRISVKQEKMVDSQPGTRFQFDHTYDSAGNRTALAISGNLYNARSFGYTFNAWGNVTQVTENVNLSSGSPPGLHRWGLNLANPLDYSEFNTRTNGLRCD